MLYDKDIREPLFEYLEARYGKIRIFEEKRMGKSRADIVMVTEFGIVGIEIKSDADSYVRLDSQVSDYDRYFDYNLVVVGSSHALRVGEHIPEHWGIVSVEEIDGTADFYEYRPMRVNETLDGRCRLSLLWRPELAAIQEQNKMPAYKEKSKLFVIEKILQRVPKEKLDGQIVEALFERDYSTIGDQINAYRVANGAKPRRATKRKRRKYRSIL